MLFFKIAIRNLWRNKRRTFIELASVSGAVFLAIFYNNFAQGSYDGMIDQGVRSGSGHVGVYHENYLEDRKLRQIVPNADEVADYARPLDFVEHVDARIQAQALARSAKSSRPVGILGLDTEKSRHTLLKPEIYTQGRVPGVERYRGGIEVAIGETLAKKLGLKLKRKFVIMAQNADGEQVAHLCRVMGIFKAGLREFDEGIVLMHRGPAGDALAISGSAHEVALVLSSPQYIEPTRAAMSNWLNANDRREISAYSWEEAMPQLVSAIKMDAAGLQVTIFIIYFLVAIGTVNTMLMSVTERTREIGVIRSLGMTRLGVARMVVTEAAVLGMLGVLLGLSGAVGLGWYTANEGVDVSGLYPDGVEMSGVLVEPMIYSTWDVPAMIWLSLGMVVITVIAALYPIRQTAKIQPADAMRHY